MHPKIGCNRFVFNGFKRKFISIDRQNWDTDAKIVL